jgi:hypothetical protein
MHVVVEGDTDIPVLEKLAADARLPMPLFLDMGGKGQLDTRLAGFNRAARGGPWVVVRDLDNDAPCAPSYVSALKLKPARWMVFTLAVRELESWLLADASALAEFLGVKVSMIPEDPDREEDPTETIVGLARRSSRPSIKRAMVPASGSNAQVGPLYEARIIEFGRRDWDVERACRRSVSLGRTRRAMRDLGDRWSDFIGGGGNG